MNVNEEQRQYQLNRSHEDRSGKILITITIVTVLATFAVVLRLVARKITHAKILADDHFTVAALVRVFDGYILNGWLILRRCLRMQC